MRAKTVAALKEYWAETDDPTDDPRFIGSEEGIPAQDPHHFRRLVLRALREIEQDRQADRAAAQAAIQDLRQRVTALEQA